MSLPEFFELAKSFGWEGLVAALLVLVLIYLAKFGGLIKNGNVARVVNVALAVMFGGFQFGDDKAAFVTVLASIASALLFTFIEWVSGKISRGI